MTVDQILNFEGELPQEVSVEGKPGFEQISMINQLDEDDKSIVCKIIDTMLTKKIQRLLSERCCCFIEGHKAIK